MRTTLLTGATDGIGLALARKWDGRDEGLLLHGRRPLEELDASVFAPARYVRADLAEVEGPLRVKRALESANVEALDLLVLNAAQGWYGELEEQTAEEMQGLIEVDLHAPLRLCHLLLPHLKRARGRIVYVSSVVSTLPCPQFAVYAACKAAVEGFLRSLRIELEGEVEVQVLRPGAARTGMHKKSGVPPQSVDWRRFPPAEEIADAILRAVSGPPHWVTLGLGNRLLFAAGRSLPRLVDRMQRSAR